MRKEQVQLGEHYIAKISGTLTVVRLDKEHRSGGWVATNKATGKQVRIRTAGKLRRKARPGEYGGKVEKQPAATKAPDPKPAKAQPARCGRKASKTREAQQIKIAAGETFQVRSGNVYRINMAGEKVVYAQQLRDGKPSGPTRPFDRASLEAGQPHGTRGEDSYYPKSEALEAAATVLAKAKNPMTAKDIMQEILRRKLWFTTARTPHITLAVAIGREIKRKGTASRFARADRGLFRLRKTGKAIKASKTSPKQEK